MPSTYSSILTAVQTRLVTQVSALTSTNTLIVVDGSRPLEEYGRTLAYIIPQPRSVAGFAGGLHFKQIRWDVSLWVRLELDKWGSASDALTHATLGLLALDDAVEAALLNETLSSLLHEACELTGQARAMAWGASEGGSRWVTCVQSWQGLVGAKVSEI